MMEYKRFKTEWQKVMRAHKKEMLDYENDNSGEVEFTDIILDRVYSNADNKKPNFYAGCEILLDVARDEDVNPMPTRYYIKTTSENISLQHDFMEDSFTNIWGLPQSVENGLIKALLSDVVEEFEECFVEGFLPHLFEKLFTEGFLTRDQFSTEIQMLYYQKYGSDSMLSKEAQDIFLF